VKRGISIPAGALLLGGALALLVALLVSEVRDGGWTKPPSLKAQVRQLSGTVRECQRFVPFPKDGKGLAEGGVLVAIVRGGDCLMSDELRFYRYENERLKQISSLAPAGETPRRTFSCIGESKTDPCHVRLAGSSRVIAGAFRDTESSQEVALAVRFDGQGLHLSSLSPPAGPPHNVNQAMRGAASHEVNLQLRVGGSAPTAGGCEPRHGCLRARPAATTGVLEPAGVRPAVLLAGYAAHGTIGAPDALQIQAWRIRVPPGKPPRPQRNRDCLVLVEGAPQPLAPPLKPTTTLRAVLFASAHPKQSQMMC
jgi:hypothetical protein